MVNKSGKNRKRDEMASFSVPPFKAPTKASASEDQLEYVGINRTQEEFAAELKRVARKRGIFPISSESTLPE